MQFLTGSFKTILKVSFCFAVLSIVFFVLALWGVGIKSGYPGAEIVVFLYMFLALPILLLSIAIVFIHSLLTYDSTKKSPKDAKHPQSKKKTEQKVSILQKIGFIPLVLGLLALPFLFFMLKSVIVPASIESQQRERYVDPNMAAHAKNCQGIIPKEKEIECLSYEIQFTGQYQLCEKISGDDRKLTCLKKNCEEDASYFVDKEGCAKAIEKYTP